MTQTMTIKFTLNGRPRRIDVVVHHTLLQVLREQIGLTGSKECCVVGECGACTVMVDGHAINSCLMLAVEADGHEIRTVEGLAPGRELSRLQQAFLDKGATQCGFCIPGQLVAAQALLERNPEPGVADIHEALAGNLCRCAGYEQITEAVLAAAAADGEER